MSDDGGQPSRASEWLVALLDRPEDRDLQDAFARWIDAAPIHARDWEEIAQTYEAMGTILPSYRRPSPARVAPAGRRVVAFPQRRRALMLAVAAMAACLAVILLPDAALWLRADHATGRGEIARVALADGSVVRLAPDSAISVDFAAGRRTVALLRGRAFFEVTPDPTRPFEVAAAPIRAMVLGTAFEVRNAHQVIGVAVREGRVRVAEAATAQDLTAGGWMGFGPGGKRRQGIMNPHEVAAWLEGRLIARDMSVDEAVAELRHYYRGVVILRGESLARQPLTGVYSLTDPDAAFAAIAAAQGARLYRLSPWITVISGG